MNRRGLLRTLILTATTPIVVPMVAEKCASIKRWWVPTQIWEKEFDFGRAYGIAIEYKNVLTGELARSAVRVADFTGARLAEYRAFARRHLDLWAKDLPAVIGRRPAKPYTEPYHFDEVLEGREARITWPPP